MLQCRSLTQRARHTQQLHLLAQESIRVQYRYTQQRSLSGMTVPVSEPFVVSTDGTTAKAKHHPTQQHLAALAEEHRNTLQARPLHPAHAT